MRPFQSLHLSRGLSREERRNISCQSSKHILWGSWSKNLFLTSWKVTNPKWPTFSRVARSQKATETFIHDTQSVSCSFLTHRRNKVTGPIRKNPPNPTTKPPPFLSSNIPGKVSGITNKWTYIILEEPWTS